MSKDSEDVIRFMNAFGRLKDIVQREGAGCLHQPPKGHPVIELCWELSFAEMLLEDSEASQPRLFSTPCDPKFISAWREYKNEFSAPASNCALGEFIADLEETVGPRSKGWQRQWENADEYAQEEVGPIYSALEFASQQADPERGLPAEFVEEIERGVASWSRFCDRSGFDLRGVMRRRKLIPFVLVPRHVGNREGRPETSLLLQNLRQAHEAFIFGIPNAAVALMRSVLEGILRDHHKIPGQKLDELIQNSETYDAGVGKAELRKLQKMGNIILHGRLDSHDKRHPPKDVCSEEKETVQFLLALRRLIEATPEL